MATTRSLLALLARASRRPGVLAGMLRAAWRFRARGWWRRPPFLPLPPREYLDWRLHTAYGDGERGPTVSELGRYLRWANRTYRSRTGPKRR